MPKATNGKAMKTRGSAYERALARVIDAAIFEGSGKVLRTPLSGGGFHIGGGGMPDLIGTPHVWVEAKRTQRFSPYEAMAQAERGIAGRKSTDMPVVISRRDQVPDSDSLVVMRLHHWLRLYRAFLIAHPTDYVAPPPVPTPVELSEIPSDPPLCEFSALSEEPLP